jgi:hypothetical protein
MSAAKRTLRKKIFREFEMKESSAHPRVSIFCPTKAGNTDGEYEDAACMASEIGAKNLSRYAVDSLVAAAVRRNH